ncbi:Protein TAT-2 a, partial [Aphelenchoides avenae]
SLRSGYAFSHSQGFGELIAKGTLFRNLEHLRVPSNRSTSPTKSPGGSFGGASPGGLSPIIESPQGPPGFATAIAPSMSHFAAGGPGSLPVQSTSGVHSIVVNADEDPLPQSWRMNSDGTLDVPELEQPPAPGKKKSASPRQRAKKQPSPRPSKANAPARDKAASTSSPESDTPTATFTKRSSPSSSDEAGPKPSKAKGPKAGPPPTSTKKPPKTRKESSNSTTTTSTATGARGGGPQPRFVGRSAMPRQAAHLETEGDVGSLGSVERFV